MPRDYGWRPTQTSYGLLPQLQPGVRNRPQYGRQEIPRGYIPDPRILDPEAEAPAPRYVRPVERSEGDDIFEADPNAASYSSPAEAKRWISSAADHGYYGTVKDAAMQAKQGNQKAINALEAFVTNLNRDPISLGKKAPGLLGTITDYFGIGGNKHGGVTPNTQTAIEGLASSGNLFSNPNDDSWTSSGYQGDTLEEQQAKSDVHAASTYGDWSSWADDSSSDDGWGDDSGLDSSSDSFSDDGGGWT